MSPTLCLNFEVASRFLENVCAPELMVNFLVVTSLVCQVTHRSDICHIHFWQGMVRPVFTHGPQGPGPRALNFQGRHIKKIEIEVWYAEKKGCPRERNLREIYTEKNVGTEFSRYDATGARRSWGWIRTNKGGGGGAKNGPGQGECILIEKSYIHTLT
jgi:hypothetical protein